MLDIPVPDGLNYSMGRKRTLPDAEPRSCEGCGSVFTPIRKKWRARYCSLPCQNKMFRDAGNSPEARAKAAPKLRAAQLDTGECKTYRKFYGVHEHRVVAEKKLGRKLRYEDVVHHLDGNKRNNDPDNLVVITRQEHIHEHLPEMRRLRNLVPPKLKKLCSVEECDRFLVARGLCSLHYSRARTARKGGAT